MNRLYVVLILAVCVLILFGVALMAGRAQRGLAIPTADKRFRARRGTTREKARVFWRKGKPTSTKPQKNAPNEGEGYIDPPEGMFDHKDSPDSFAAQTVYDALNALSPEHGIDLLLSTLSKPEAADGASRLYTALGILYAQTVPPDFEQAKEAFATAKRLADDADQKHDAVLAEANVLLQAGDAPAALDLVNECLALSETVTAPRLELEIMRGQLCARLGRTADAEAALLKAMERCLQAYEQIEGPALSNYRHAAFRLNRLYRDTGRAGEADALAQEVRRRAALLESPG